MCECEPDDIPSSYAQELELGEPQRLCHALPAPQQHTYVWLLSQHVTARKMSCSHQGTVAALPPRPVAV